MVDVDALTVLHPAPVDDPFNDRVALALLSVMKDVFVARGVEVLVLPRVIETAAGLEAYREALAPYEVSVARVTASSETRRLRLRIRHADTAECRWHLERTEELEQILAGVALEDVTVSTDSPDGSLFAAVALRQWLNGER